MKFNRLLSLALSAVALMLTLTLTPTNASGFDLMSLFSKHRQPAGYMRTKAYIEESPEIGLGFHKIPIMIPLPTLIFRKNKVLITKPVHMPVCGGGCGGGGYPGSSGGGYGGY